MAQEASAFRPRTVAAMVIAGIVAFAAFLLLLAYGGNFRGGEGRPNPLSSSAVGFKGIVALIETSGGRAELLRTEAALETEDLVVATLEPRTSPGALEAFLAQREDRATLLVLPKYHVFPHELRPGWVRTGGWLAPDEYEELLEHLGDPTVHLTRAGERQAQGRAMLDGFSAPLPAAVQTVRGEGLEPLLVTSDGDILLARMSDEAHYLLAEPDLLNNRGFGNAEAARAALDLLAELNSTDARSVSFDLTLNGYGLSPNLLRLAFEPPFLPLTVVIVIAALLAGLHGAARFGPEAREGRAIALGKTALVENSAALFRIARREHATGGAYAEAVKESAAREAGVHAEGEAELQACLDRISPAGGATYSELAARAASARSSSELLAAARALFEWKRGLIK